MKTNLNANENAATDIRPWWKVRAPLLAILTTLALVWVAMVSPTPFRKWVFGDGALTVGLASR